MSDSGQTARAIELEPGDLLMPERRVQQRNARARDIEDASFETLDRKCETQPGTRFGPNSHQLFKSCLTGCPADGSIARDVSSPDRVRFASTGSGERLDVFTKGPAQVFDKPMGRETTGSAFVLTICAVAAIAFWMAGGHALVLDPASNLHATTSVAPAALVAQTSAEPASDPVVTSSVFDRKIAADGGSIIHAPARPARIERAGSILMIRPDGG